MLPHPIPGVTREAAQREALVDLNQIIPAVFSLIGFACLAPLAISLPDLHQKEAAKYALTLCCCGFLAALAAGYAIPRSMDFASAAVLVFSMFACGVVGGLLGIMAFLTFVQSNVERERAFGDGT